MKRSSLEFLRRLLDAPGPSGFETAPASVWRAEAAALSHQVHADVSGNSVAVLNPEGRPRVMLAGHIDEIGLMVVHVDDEGFLYFQPIGGWDSQVLVGQRVVISAGGGAVPGVIGKKPIHLIKQEDRDKITKVADLWIDIGARSKKDALERVRVGDPVVLGASALELPNGRLVSRSIDNRIGAFVVLEALRRLKARPPAAAVHAVATAQEEIGWFGGGARTSATGIEPALALVVDVTHATDCPSIEKKEHGDIRLGGGPVLSRGSCLNPVVFDLLAETAEREKIPYTVQAAPRDTSTDADAIATAQRGVATGLISIPNRYMHSPNEMVDLADVEHTAELLAAVARRVTEKTDFTPK
ncbi:MAG TPA: M42 family metallopeptidase [Gemmatimonadales bacterium]|nr:M42 family metallopeptidase [Gemmatimonadales bacterium]